jgi:hypothetical protein
MTKAEIIKRYWAAAESAGGTTYDDDGNARGKPKN